MLLWKCGFQRERGLDRPWVVQFSVGMVRRIETDNLYHPSFGGGEGPSILKLRDNLLRKMKIVAKARFNASARLDAKASATNIGLQLTNLYTIALGILLIQFKNYRTISDAEDVLNYVSLLASVFVQIMALIESFKDYSGKAKAMHACGTKVNGLMQRLEADGRLDWRVIQAYTDEYNNIMKETDLNHHDIDYRKYMLELNIERDINEWAAREESSTAARSGKRLPDTCWQFDIPRALIGMSRMTRWRLRYAWNVYALMTMIVLGPWTVLFGLLWLDLK